METLAQDLRFAVRALGKAPAFSAIAILTLALGIGANTAIFSVIDAVLLRTLPIPDPQQLVVISNPEIAGMQNGSSNGERDLIGYHEFEGLRDQNNVFSGTFAVDSRGETSPVSLDGSSELGSPASISMVSGGYFRVLEAEPLEGRTFGTEVDQGIGAHPQAVISYAFWERRLQRNPTVIGSHLRIRQTVFDVIGVMPPDFTGVSVGDAPDIWIPLTMQQAVFPGRDLLTWQAGSITKIMFLQVVGRTKPGITLDQVKASINVTFQQVLRAEAGTLTDPALVKDFLDQSIVPRDARNGLSAIRGQYEKPLAILMVLVGLVLLLACANVANLLLARATGRRRELAVRLAIGASRGRLIRQLLTESLLLAVVGGACGLLFSLWADRLLIRMVSTGPTPLPLDVHPDVRVLAFTIGATVLTGILFGLAPAIRATRIELNNILRGSSRSIAGAEGNGRLPMGKLLVGIQVAISLLLLVSAGLFIRSLQKLTSVNLGYDAGHLVLFRMSPQMNGYKQPAIDALFRELIPKFDAIPGVTGATLSENGLFFGTDSGDNISILGYTPKSGQNMNAAFDQIGPSYFKTIGIPMLMGRDVDFTDLSGPRHCWINQTMRRYYFGDDNPLGRHLVDEYPDNRIDCEIAGVVGDAKYNALRGQTDRRFYFTVINGVAPVAQAVFEIHFTGASSAGVSAAIREAVRQTDSTLDPLELRTIGGQIDRRLIQDRLTARLSGFFGAVALLLACIGLYGVLSYNVTRRTSEIGVRLAMGAQKGDILGLILREALLVTVIGTAVGLGAAVAATRIMESMLYGLTARDPTTLIGAAIILLAVASLAAAVPAWRASRVDPMTALRYE
ncbi:MAG TPA: ABC transporter permease [Candidatus Acidoferrales bacterium]|nr:ABC transporter permease [Candidatus Acidoferrales bacterium]